MIRKIIVRTFWVIIIAMGITIACSPKMRESMRAIWLTFTGDAVDLLESQFDQGELALQRFDSEYIKAQQKLATLKTLQAESKLSMRRAQERAADYRRAGKEDLALRNDEQIAFFQKQMEGYENTIASRTAKLIELKALRERAQEDVRLARERIAILRATRDALDSEQQQENLARAQENINNLQSHCARLSAEIDVINLTE